MMKQKKSYIIVTLFILSLTLSLMSISAFAEGACVHTDTEAIADGGGGHRIYCKDCNITLGTEACYGGEAICGHRANCEACGAEYGPLPLPHLYSDSLTYSTLHHFYFCTECGTPDPTSRELHSYGEWYTLLSATEDKSGTLARDCGICGYRQTGAIPPRVSDDNTAAVIALSASLAVLLALAAFGVWLFITKKSRKHSS